MAAFYSYWPECQPADAVFQNGRVSATGRGVSWLTLCMFQCQSVSYGPGCQPADAVYVSECESGSYRPGCQPADAVYVSE